MVTVPLASWKAWSWFLREPGMLQALCWPLPLCLANLSSRPWLPSLPEGALLQETVPIYFIFEQLCASFASMYVDQFLKNTSWVPAWIRVGWRPLGTSRAWSAFRCELFILFNDFKAGTHL